MKKIVTKFGWLFIALFLASCASEPEAPVVEETTPVQEEIAKEPEVVEQVEIESAAKSAEELAAIASKNTADEARMRALGVKAQNAAKEIFASAQALYDTAVKAYESKEFSVSQKNWDDSIPIYNESHDAALEAREKALAAMENAKKAIEEADAIVNAAEEDDGSADEEAVTQE